MGLELGYLLDSKLLLSRLMDRIMGFFISIDWSWRRLFASSMYYYNITCANFLIADFREKELTGNEHLEGNIIIRRSEDDFVEKRVWGMKYLKMWLINTSKKNTNNQNRYLHVPRSEQMKSDFSLMPKTLPHMNFLISWNHLIGEVISTLCEKGQKKNHFAASLIYQMDLTYVALVRPL